jgi:hypothetical protein
MYECSILQHGIVNLHPTLCTCRWRAGSKDFSTVVPVLDSRQRIEQLQRLHQLQQQQAAAAAAGDPSAAAAEAPAAAAAEQDIAATLSALLRHQLQPAPQYDTAGTVHWSLLQYRQAVQQAEEAAAAAAVAATAAAKKRSAAAAGLGDRGGLGGGGGGGSSSKRIALSDFGLPNAAAGEQWWYVPGTASEAEQVRQQQGVWGGVAV